MRYEVVADTFEGVFADFRPYVPSINDLGEAAFQASLASGGDGLFVGRTRASSVPRCVSHPDLNDQGDLCAYRASGKEAHYLWSSKDGELAGGFSSIGPLGPTMNETGSIAFRGEREHGVSGIHLIRGLEVVPIAEVGEQFLGFQGLPVVNARDQVVFRADLPSGQGIYLWENGVTKAIVETGQHFQSLGNFPCLNDHGHVAFASDIGVFCSESERARPLIDDTIGFESFRGVLLDNGGRFVFYATPAGGALGIFGPEGKLLWLGQEFLDSKVAEFALNPVSMNNSGHIAVRVMLENERQMILKINLTPHAA